MARFPRGSQWRRWDLHIHTPGTIKNDQFTGKNIDEKWDLFYKAVSAYVGDGTNPLKAIAVVGITNYMAVDNYLRSTPKSHEILIFARRIIYNRG